MPDLTLSGRARHPGLRLALAGAAVAACLALVPLHAEAATTRYAAPDGVGASPCLQSDPCDLETAVASGAGGTQTGDTILLAPGTYHQATSVQVFPGVTLSGEPGQPPPLIETTGEFGLFFQEASTVRDLRILSSSATQSGLLMLGKGTAERVESTGEAQSACSMVEATLRDVLCSSERTDGGGEGIFMFVSGSTPEIFEASLFNVTAIGSADGIAVITNQASSLRVTAVNTIASGEFDVVDKTFATTAEAKVDFSHSNFSEVLLEGVHAEFTPPTSAGNQPAEPLFVNAAAGNYAEAEGSPTRGAGDAAVVLPGETDLSGQPRTCFGDGTPSVDIGAYQFQVQCLPQPNPPSGGSGPAAAIPAPILAPVAPRLSGLSLSRKRFAVAGSKAPKGMPHGTVIGFSLSEPAAVTITILGKRAKPGKKPKLVRLGKLTSSGVAGKNRVKFSGKLKGKPLAPGKYKLELTAKASSGLSSMVLSAPFQIVG